MHFEKCLIEHCAPTLASLKTASLFNLSITPDLENQLSVWNNRLQKKGIFLFLLCRQGKRALIYVCRKSHLQADLEKPGVQSFLALYGYRQMDIMNALGHLQKRVKENRPFPHEIGLFLGYPLEDVKGFIENSGRNCKCSGCWKVYSNECEAIKMFERYKKCKNVYKRQWEQGRSVWKLTVAA